MSKPEFADTLQPDWQKMHDLLPAIIQHAHSGQVLMLGYMNAEALAATRSTGKVTFFSRSKQRLWIKGETSGHSLQLVNIDIDCDRDTLLIQALPNGPVCHLQTATCFGDQPYPPQAFLGELEAIIQSRAEQNPEQSYTASLLQGTMQRAAQKVGEEGVEVALAAVAENQQELLDESADLLYHLLVLLQKNGLSLNAVSQRLQQRHTEK